jgi:hypothetical protein
MGELTTLSSCVLQKFVSAMQQPRTMTMYTSFVLLDCAWQPRTMSGVIQNLCPERFLCNTKRVSAKQKPHTMTNVNARGPFYHTYIHVYNASELVQYMYVCVCVCVCVYIYIYIYI